MIKAVFRTKFGSPAQAFFSNAHPLLQFCLSLFHPLYYNHGRGFKCSSPWFFL
jgi:hypothetical protein